MATLLAGGLFATRALFKYNRKNFMFDKTLRQEREFQEQDMRVAQFSLYREDVRDLVELTVGKMDLYLVSAALLIDRTTVMITKADEALPGFLPWDPTKRISPEWAVALNAMSLASGVARREERLLFPHRAPRLKHRRIYVFYLLLCLWMAMYASISAQSFGTRLLTQFVRLPVASQSNVAKATATAVQYEEKGVGEMLRARELEGPLSGADVQLLQLSLTTDLMQHTPSHVSPDAMRPGLVRFMHIPKTGGTSIDAAGMHQAIPAFDSLMRQTYERIAQKSDYHGDLGDLYVSSHSSYLTYSAFIAQNVQEYHFLPPNASDQCEDLHTPPSRSEFIREYYRTNLTFCAVRDPLERFWSAFRMMSLSACEPEAIEAATLGLLATATVTPYICNCFLVPQMESVYGTRHLAARRRERRSGGETRRNWSTSSTRYCQRVSDGALRGLLYQENLTAEFEAFMEEIGRPEELMADWSSCDLKTGQLTPKTRQVYEFYKADYEAFGYAPPSEVSAPGPTAAATTEAASTAAQAPDPPLPEAGEGGISFLGRLPSANGYIGNPTVNALPAAMLDHIRLYRRVQLNWQAYDAYARVSLFCGANSLLYSCLYWALGSFLGGQHAGVAAIAVALVFATIQVMLTKLDLRLRAWHLRRIALLLFSTPVTTTIGMILYPEVTNGTLGPFSAQRLLMNLCAIVAHVLHFAVAFMVLLASWPDDDEEALLPGKFRSTLYLDVFGWLLNPTGPGARTSAAREEEDEGWLVGAAKTVLVGAEDGQNALGEPRQVALEVGPPWRLVFLFFAYLAIPSG
ncbi:unnamed protein product [Durusdinium trenchii]|uniref:Uncharacterized protein n=1 Tax=Durusdinium trenchii TaxID=1381693 RepID=A0ABP0SCF3_9DINO